MASADWNTIASDLQRAVNNLVWYVLESMSIPEQPPLNLPLQQWPLIQQGPPPPPPPMSPSMLPKSQKNNGTVTKKRRPYKNNVLHEQNNKKQSIGEAFDALVAETLV